VKQIPLAIPLRFAYVHFRLNSFLQQDDLRQQSPGHSDLDCITPSLHSYWKETHLGSNGRLRWIKGVRAEAHHSYIGEVQK
jgi:hypothetical protein